MIEVDSALSLQADDGVDLQAHTYATNLNLLCNAFSYPLCNQHVNNK